MLPSTGMPACKGDNVPFWHVQVASPGQKCEFFCDITNANGVVVLRNAVGVPHIYLLILSSTICNQDKQPVSCSCSEKTRPDGVLKDGESALFSEQCALDAATWIQTPGRAWPTPRI